MVRQLVCALAAVTVLVGWAVSSPLRADGATHGLALFADLKYDADFTHFDYVNPDAPKGGDVRYATVGSFDNLNPFILKGVAAAGAGLPFDSLLASSFDEPDSAYGLIAESVERAEDYSWVRFVLRPEARWHDGTPITADDVVFTFNVLIEKGHPNYRIILGGVSGVEKTGQREITYHITDTENRKLALLIGGLPVLPKAHYEANPFDRTTLTPPPASGPYRFKTIDPGRAVVLERVPDYWAADLPVNRGRHNFDLIHYDYYRDRDVLVEALKAAEFDIHEEFTSKTWATAYDIRAVEDGVLIKETLADNTPSGVQAYFINTRREKFQDPRVREALSFAFDYEWTNKNIFFGAYYRMASYFENSELAARGLPSAAELALLEPWRGQVPEQLFTQPFEPPVTDGSGNSRRNLRTASRLLKEAGWTSKDGKRVHAETGEALVIEFLYFERTFERVIGPYARNLEKLGIEVSLRLVDVTQFVKRLEEHDFDITTRRFVQQLSPGAELWTYFGSEMADQYGTLNSSGIKNPAVDALISKVLNATSRADMVTAARALDRVLLWGHYMVPQWYKGQHNIVYWDKFSRPATKPLYDMGLDTWWLDVDKKAKLDAYRGGAG